MGFPTITQLTSNDRASVVDIPDGRTLPIPYTIDSDSAATAGVGTLTLSLTTADGATAGGSDSVELEHDSEIFFPSSNTVAVDGAGGIGKRTIDVDNGSDGLPTNLVAVGNYIKFAGHAQRYLIKERTAGATEYSLRLDPALKAAPADDEAVTVYNVVRLNLGTGIQFVEITSAGASVPVTGVTYPMAGPTTSLVVYEMRQLLGVTDMSPTPTVASTEVTDMKSKANIQGDTTFDLSISGVEFNGNSGLGEVVLPSLLDSDDTSVGVYFIYVNQDGKRIQDTGSFTASGGAGPVEAARTYDVTISANLGDNFERWQP
ncbi:MAG: hypothetical protein AAF959_15215 [Cyanobacteria bacterium P01_D01_bin.56]